MLPKIGKFHVKNRRKRVWVIQYYGGTTPAKVVNDKKTVLEILQKECFVVDDKSKMTFKHVIHNNDGKPIGYRGAYAFQTRIIYGDMV